MKRIARRCVVVLAGFALACDRPAPARSNDTPVVVLAPPDTTSPAIPLAEAPFMAQFGHAFLVRTEGSTEALVVYPSADSGADVQELGFRGDDMYRRSVDLFANGRRVAPARVDSALTPDVPSDCSRWPVARLAVTDSLGSQVWSVGFESGKVMAEAVDSMATWSRADSLRTVREVARLASTAPGDTLDALRGVPYVVQRVYTARFADSSTVLLAEVTRALNQEANPVAERLLLVAERVAGSWIRKYAERDVGDEESVGSTVPLFMGTIAQTRSPIVLLERALGDGVRYSLLARMTDGSWRLVWSSPYTGC